MTITIPAPCWYDDPEQVALCRRVHCATATDDEFDTFKSVCKRTGLDPFARQIYATFRKSQRNGVWTQKMEIQASIDGFRVVAERSGSYAGQTAPLWCGPDGKWTDVWLSPEPPSACKIGVHRTTFKEPLIAVATWDSYAQYGKGEGQNSQPKLGHMWAKMPDLMLSKVAEALALRRAFPQDLSGLYTSDEMAQAGNPVIRTSSQGKEAFPIGVDPNTDELVYDQDQRRPEDRKPLPKTRPLAAGTFQQAETVETPQPAIRTPPKASQPPSPALPAAPIITDWKELPYTNGKGKTKKLGAMSLTFLEDLHKHFNENKPRTKEHELVKAGLQIWHDETHKTPLQRLQEMCMADDVDPKALLIVAQKGYSSIATTFNELEEDIIGVMLDDWNPKVLEAAQFESDALPK